MAEKGETKLLVIITICVILISIGLGGCIGDDDEKKEKEDNQEIKYKGPYKFENREFISYTYIIEIDNNQNPFEIEIPFPINKNSSVEKIFENITILKGNCSFELIDSEKGISLNINGENNVKLHSTIIQEGNISFDSEYDKLSMTNFKNVKETSQDIVALNSWFYSNDNIVNIYFKFEYQVGFYRYPGPTFWGGFGEWSYSGSLKKGWQELEIKGFDAEA